MTSEGGGAIAFPVMTLVLGVAPVIARDFSLMIQSFGMTAASITLAIMKVTLEYSSLVVCTTGGVAGIIFGLHIVDPALSSSAKKIGFVSIWFAFASVLVFLNRYHKRPTFSSVQNLNWWRVLVLLAAGFLGGIFTSFAGSGLDICSFSVLTLLFRISEKVATPTSVVLMAINTVVGFYWRGAIIHGISEDTWEYLFVCVPIVVIGAPLGSLLGSHFHRLTLAALVICVDILALVGAYAIVPLTPALIGASVGIIIAFFGVFMGLNYAGQRMLDRTDGSGFLIHPHEKKKAERDEYLRTVSSRTQLTEELPGENGGDNLGCNGSDENHEKGGNITEKDGNVSASPQELSSVGLSTYM